MTEADHKEAFLAAVKGVPNHVVTRVLNNVTTGPVWTRCSKDYMAQCYAKAKRPDHPLGHEQRRFANLTNLDEFRRTLLDAKTTAIKYRADREAAEARRMAEITANLKAKKERQELAERMIAAVDLIEARIKAAPSFGMAADIQKIINEARSPK